MPRRCAVCPLPVYDGGDLCGACVYQWRQIVRNRDELRTTDEAPAIRLVRTGTPDGRVVRKRASYHGRRAKR